LPRAGRVIGGLRRRLGLRSSLDAALKTVSRGQEQPENCSANLRWKPNVAWKTPWSR